MEVEHVGEVLVITLPARLDAAGLVGLQDRFAEVVTAHKGKVLADMGRVTFVASLALRMLLMNLKAVQPDGGDLRLCALQPQIAEIFRKSRFDTLFQIFPDRASGLASYAVGQS